MLTLLSQRKAWDALRSIRHRFQFALASHFGRRSAAQGALKAAAAMVPEDDKLQYALSRAHRNAGAFADAELAMERVVALRGAHLPPTLQEGLVHLRSRPGIEPSRLALEWAWRNLSPPGAIRTQWESAARFGQASNALIWNWANCARDRAEELDELILPLDESAERALHGRNRGLLLLGAHVGVPHAGVHYLGRRFPRVRIFGGEPGSSLLGTAESYIHSDDRFSLRHVLRGIDDGSSIGLLGDSWGETARVDAPLPGKAKLRLMSWIPKVIWRHRLTYMYCFPIWEGDRIRIHLIEGACLAQENQPFDSWQTRWLSEYRERVLERGLRICVLLAGSGHNSRNLFYATGGRSRPGQGGALSTFRSIQRSRTCTVMSE
jgi:hypothetical protein